MFPHAIPGPGALLMIHCMWVYGAVVALFGVYCVYKGIREFLRRFK